MTQSQRAKTLAVLISLFIAEPALGAAPAGTAFTYQGRLTDGAVPASTSYDLQFTLFDDALGSTTVGPVVSRPGVVVTGGLFTVPLDFGVNAFTGSARWLEIGVKPVGGMSYTTLTPRQELKPAPYALHALDTAPPPTAASYAYAYDTTTQNAPGGAGSFTDITFDTNVSLDGWTHAAGTSTFTCPSTGLFQVSYGAGLLRYTGGVTAITTLRLAVNDVEVPGSRADVHITTIDVLFPVFRTALVPLTAGDILRLQHGASNSFTNISFLDSAPSATLSIVRLK